MRLPRDLSGEELVVLLRQYGYEITHLSEETHQLSTTITSLIEKTEREHRFKQVRIKIAEEILALL
jgi:hypothetical protein